MPEGRSETVLIVEDDPGVARLERLRLERAGYRAATAAAPEEALEAIRRGGVDLIVLDQGLSAGVSGLDFYRRLKAEGHDLPAILVTGSSDETTVVEAIRAGLRDFLPKASDFLETLPSVVDRVLGQVRAERRLAESEARLAGIALLAEAIPQLVWASRPDGWNDYLNRRWIDFAGRPLDELKGWGWSELLHPDDRPRTIERWSRALATGELYEIEYRLRGADGTFRWYLARGLPLTDPEGHVVQWFGTCTDIDDRRRAEEELQAHARQRAAIAELGQRALAGIDLDRLMDETAAGLAAGLDVEFCKVLELRADGQTLRLRAGVGWREGLVGRAMVGAEPGSQAGYTLRRNGPVIVEDLSTETRFHGPSLLQEHGVVSGMSVIIPGRGRPFGVLGIHTARRRTFTPEDVHFLQSAANVVALAVQRDQAERERARLLRAEQAARREAERANQAKDQFLAVLSHELRTPLTPVLASVSAMLDEVTPVPEEHRATLQMIRRGVELEARLIDDLLDVTRIARGQLALNREVVEVHTLIRQTAEICRSGVHGGKIRLDLDLRAPRSHVEADPARLHQVLWNLIKNAVKFTPAGGRVAVRTRNAADPPRLVVEVADTGIGIEAEALPRIFNAFEQGESSTVRRFGGLGLGLAISRSVVEALGGTIEARSRGKDQGATFLVALDCIPAPPVREPSAPAPAPEPRPALKILLVEDDPPTRRVMARLLQQRQYRVLAAADLKDALEIGQREEFDILVSDIGLPDGSGLDLIRALAARRPVRAIALSGFGMDDDARRCREAGFLAHLTKPVDFAKLEAVIRSIADVGRAGMMPAERA